MTLHILYDGMNLSLTRGTGVATYTRCAVQLSRELGYRNGILYSRKFKAPADPLLREISFFDADVPNTALRVLGIIDQYSLGLIGASIAGVRPQKVPVTGSVLTAPLGTAWVPADDVYSAPDVFEQARPVFGATGQFLRVKFPQRPDLFHWTYPMALKSNARANIYTIHDLVPLRLPYASLDWKQYHLRLLRKVVAKADHIVTVSEHSKQDIMRYLGVEESRITNTYESADIPRSMIERDEDSIANELAGTFGLEFKKYFLYYGSLDPKKNIGRIIQAYLAANVAIPLVLVFAQSWLGENETRILNQALGPLTGEPFFSTHSATRLLNQSEGPSQGKPPLISSRGKRIQRYEYLPFRMLGALIRGARAVVFPSLYEGFGLPVLESMMLGTPVISSTMASIPEVAGDAAILVDPLDVEAIRNAMVTVANDSGLCQDLQARGLKRAEVFSMAAYRDRLQKLYTSLT